MTMKDAKKFVATFHRHNDAPLAGIFAVGLEHDDLIIGCAIAGRPIARLLDDGYTLEVTRTCTAPSSPKGAVSMLYGACRRAAAALGYHKCLTYTLQSESGASLRGAGWQQASFLEAHGGWDRPSRGRRSLQTDKTAKIRWEIVL